MKAKSLMLAAALALAAGSASAADFSGYLDKAGARAAARLAEAGVTAGQPIQIKTRIDSDGQLRGVTIVGSSGSQDTDAKARAALRFSHVGPPPVELLGRQVTLTVPAAGGPANAR
jgi:TonB family protein